MIVTNNLSTENISFPIGGEIYEAIDNVETTYIIHHSAPYTTGGKCTFPKGEKLIVSPPMQERPSGYYCVPVEYAKIEKTLIPQADITGPDYSNYSIFVDTEVLIEKFRKVNSPPIEPVKCDTK